MASFPISRRELLKRLGALGGSSVLLGAMDALELKGQPAGPRPRLRGGQQDTRVLVLGGGLSGLMVGYELGKLGYDYRIIEARDRVGGLTWSVRRGDSHTEIDTGETQVCAFDEGQYANLGAWRIPHTDEGILGYCRELGVPLEVFLNSSDANYFYEENPELGPLSGQRVRLREVKADMWGATTELLAKAMQQGDIDVPLSTDDVERLLQYLVRSGYLDSEDYVYRPPTSRGSEDRHDLDALLQSGFWVRARSLNQETGGPAPLFQPIGGMQEIAFAFQRAVGDRLSLGSEVRSVRQTEDEVRVVVRDTASGADREEVAEYCVVCLPFSILKELDVAMSSDTVAALENTGAAQVAKIGVQTRRRFWEEDEGIFGGHLWSQSLQLGEFSYPSNGYFGEKGVLLGYYGGSTQAGLNEMPVADRIEHVIRQASKVHPQMREEFDNAYAVWWEKVEYSRGAYGRRPPPDVLERLSRADGRLYFGSACASTDPSWMEGAVEAAWRSVEALHARVSSA